MNTENVRQFYETLKADPSLVEDLRTSFIAAKPETEESALDAVVNFAAGRGFAFSADEIRAFEQEARELSPEELNATNAAEGHGFGACYIMGLGFGIGGAGANIGGHGLGFSGCFAIGGGLLAWADWEKKE